MPGFSFKERGGRGEAPFRRESESTLSASTSSFLRTENAFFFSSVFWLTFHVAPVRSHLFDKAPTNPIHGRHCSGWHLIRVDKSKPLSGLARALRRPRRLWLPGGPLCVRSSLPRETGPLLQSLATALPNREAAKNTVAGGESGRISPSSIRPTSGGI